LNEYKLFSICFYSKQGLTSKAISLLKKAIELDVQFAEPYSALASLYAESGRNDDAEKLHLQALKLDAENADFCNNYGAFLQKIGIYLIFLFS
jgi:Tfp pilus assembly protein PilF